jgi:hypothetical protein
MVFNATFNNISVILVGETGVPGENQRPVISHSLSNNVLSSTPRHERDLSVQLITSKAFRCNYGTLSNHAHVSSSPTLLRYYKTKQVKVNTSLLLY